MEDKNIWDFLYAKLNNAYGVAALMGNLYVESKLNPMDLQGSYERKLKMSDAEYTEAVDNAALKTVLFADRFPFRYLADDYGLTYFAAFTGCSAESEASFATIAFLAGKTDELNLPAVLTIEGGNHKIADTVIATASNPDRKVLTMNSMQSVTAEDVENGMTYLSMMEENLTVLKEALN